MSNAAHVYSPGLEGVIAGETAISAVLQDSLTYRGYSIDDLAEHASFEEVACLLLDGELPDRARLERFRAALASYAELPPAVVDVIRAIPRDVPMMQVLRTAVSMCGHFDPVRGDGREALIERATYHLACNPAIIATRLRHLAGLDPVPPKPGLPLAAQLLYRCFGREPGPRHAQLMNLTLVLYAEHGFNASTFAARVCTSTLSDMCSALVAGIGTLRGPLHGGANEDTARLIVRFRSADEARAWTEDALAHKTKVSGFGHRVYKHGDHRCRFLEAHLPDLARERNEQFRLDVYHAIKDVIWTRKRILPNVDYPCGLVYYFMDLPTDIYTPLFVVSRTSGWCAHIIEQYLGNRIIRPEERYVGPPLRAYVPLDQR